ncbi:MAG: hypothetical protein WCX31_13070 [Salinivirgaceae bacterium]|jgi:hypothetical protein
MIVQKKYNPIKLKLSKLFGGSGAENFKRKVKACSIEKAATVGVSFVVTSPNELEEIKKILKQLHSLGIKTFALGYIPEKKPHDFYLSEKSCNFFCDKELDWFLRPNNVAAAEFQNSTFDILIDLGSYSYYPMQHLLNNSKATFKVGWYTDNGPFDLMMNIDPKKGLDFYFTQVLHYLSILK